MRGLPPLPTACSQVVEKKGRRIYEKVKSMKRRELAEEIWQECERKGDKHLVLAAG